MNEMHTRRTFLKVAALSAVTLGLPGLGRGQGRESRPNFVIIFLDDSGWADFAPFAETDYRTPHVGQLAREGCCFRNFYVPQAVCSASRAALMTGCYPGRTRVFGTHPPRARGLDPKFATLAERHKQQFYSGQG